MTPSTVGATKKPLGHGEVQEQRVRGAIVSIGLVPELDGARVAAFAERRLARAERDACRFGIVRAAGLSAAAGEAWKILLMIELKIDMCFPSSFGQRTGRRPQARSMLA